MRKEQWQVMYNDTLVPCEDQNTVQRPHMKELVSDLVDPVMTDHWRDSDQLEIAKMKRRNVPDVQSAWISYYLSLEGGGLGWLESSEGWLLLFLKPEQCRDFPKGKKKIFFLQYMVLTWINYMIILLSYVYTYIYSIIWWMDKQGVCVRVRTRALESYASWSRDLIVVVCTVLTWLSWNYVSPNPLLLWLWGWVDQEEPEWELEGRSEAMVITLWKLL